MTGARICFAGGGICLLYFITLLAYAGLLTHFAWFWAAAGGYLILTGAALRVRHSIPGAGRAAGILLGLALAAVLFFAAFFARSMTEMRAGKEDGDPLDFVVVLGAQVRGEVPSRALRMRLDRAWEYWQAHRDCVLILTGGQGSGENITEAECMRRYLAEKGLPGEKMILEDASTSTYENLIFADKLSGCAAARTGIVSNSFHIFRALGIARKLGYGQVRGLAAPTEPLMLPHYMTREALALALGKIRGML